MYVSVVRPGLIKERETHTRARTVHHTQMKNEEIKGKEKELQTCERETQTQVPSGHMTCVSVLTHSTQPTAGVQVDRLL